MTSSSDMRICRHGCILLIRYHGTLIIDEIPGHVVGTSQISKSADKCVMRKFGVVRGQHVLRDSCLAEEDSLIRR